MDVTGPIEHSIASGKVKHRFFQWATKWCYGNVEQDMEKPDVPGIVCLLQALGCQLREYEINNKSGDQKSNLMSIILECGTSGMRAVLELDDVDCKCLKQEDAKDASLWSVSGTAPTGSLDSINKFEDTGSNLLPPVSRDDRAMMRDILHHLLNTINTRRDINQNRDSTLNLSIAKNDDLRSPIDKSESFTRSFTQPEIYRVREGKCGMRTSPQISFIDRRISMSAQNIRKIPLMTKRGATPETTPTSAFPRQKTWDLDTKGDAEPRPSPPKISSSPVVLGDLCSSLGQVSLQSEDENVSLAECLKRIKYYAEKAQNSYGIISPGPGKNKVFLKPSGRSGVSPGRVNSRPSSVCSSPGLLSAKSTIQKPLARRSIGAPLPSKQLSIPKTTPTKLPPRRKSVSNSSQMGNKFTVVNSQRNPSMLKRVANKATPSTSTTSLSSNDSRVLLSAKRRISPDPKAQVPLPKGISQLKILTPKPPGVNRPLSALSAGSSGQKGNTPDASTRSLSPNPMARKNAAGASSIARKGK
uniref:Katnb1_0 protein n=1 Tax=Fopius arisanus TaxID=64838 RepID=A0A0C9RHY6_9HYME